MAAAERKNMSYRVVLQGLGDEAETLEAFWIKFSLLTSTPITKIKHLTRSIPATLWEGERRAGAVSLLSVIEEAGGRAVIEEFEKRAAAERGANEAAAARNEPEPEKETGGGPCPKCGFPNPEGERYCQFCMSPLAAETPRREVESAGAVKSKTRVPYSRILIYALVLLAALIWDFLCG